MACCYIAASMIAFIINTCDMLNVDMNLQYNESLDPSKKAESADEDVFPIEKSSGPTVISLAGMTCAACTGNVERALLALEGVVRVIVSLSFQEAKIVHEPEVSQDAMISAIEDAGYEASIGSRTADQRLDTMQQTKELQMLSTAFSGSAWLSTILFILGPGVDLLDWDSILEETISPIVRQALLLTLTIGVSFYYGSFIHRSAISQASRLSVNMNTLISISTTMGICLSAFNVALQGPAHAYTYYQTVAGLIMIVTAGRYLDMLSRRQATNTFVGLYALLKETASVKIADHKQRLPASMLKSTDQISIEPYTVIPCDSYVISGTSTVNESVVTGESYPRMKGTGDFLMAGTRNGAGNLQAIVNQDQQGSFLSQLIRTAEEASASKATAQEKVEKITRYFVSFVILLAVAITSWLYLSLDPEIPFIGRVNTASQRMMAILAAACPCALGLASPCAIMAGIDVAWRKGILMTKGAAAMESLKDVTHVVVDKTGTLTEGKLKVSRLKASGIWQNDHQLLCTLITAAEEHGASAHPIGAAVFRECLKIAGDRWSKYKEFGSIRNLEEVTGGGVKCEVDVGDNRWRSVVVGSLSLMKDNNIEMLDTIPKEVDELGSLVFASIDSRLSAVIVLQDAIRADAKETIRSLKARGLNITMLTGDNPDEASRISQLLKIPVLASGASPAKKLEIVQKLQQEGQKVAMIGDGINDGPSLAASDIGIMIAHGNKCLSAGGSVLILASKLQSLITLFNIADRTMKQVDRNIQWALVYNAIAISLAVGMGEPWGLHISPTMAAGMMSLSSIAITYQGVRLRQNLLDSL